MEMNADLYTDNKLFTDNQSIYTDNQDTYQVIYHIYVINI